MYSFVIKIAVDANRAMELDNVKPAIGFKIGNVLEIILEADPIRISLINNNTFFYLNF